MDNLTIVPKIEAPVIAILKEVDCIDNSELIYNLFDFFCKMNLNPVIISPNLELRHVCGEHCYIEMPQLIFSGKLSIYEKIKRMRSFVAKKIDINNYNIIILDVCGGILQNDHEKDEYLSLEILESIQPDYTIAHVLAEDYTEPNYIIRQLELKSRNEIESIMMSNTFFDIVKYRENGMKRFLRFSESTIETLVKKISGKTKVPVFSNSQVGQLCENIIENICFDIGDCRKVGEL